MKRNIAMAWARYLEAPRRKRAIGILDEGDGYRCCLGHLCAMLKVRKTKDHEGRIVYDGKLNVLPESVMEITGIKTSAGEYSMSKLSVVNDSGVSLKEIAKIIRKHWKEL